MSRRNVAAWSLGCAMVLMCAAHAADIAWADLKPGLWKLSIEEHGAAPVDAEALRQLTELPRQLRQQALAAAQKGVLPEVFKSVMQLPPQLRKRALDHELAEGRLLTMLRKLHIKTAKTCVRAGRQAQAFFPKEGLWSFPHMLWLKKSKKREIVFGLVEGCQTRVLTRTRNQLVQTATCDFGENH